jgi:crotonobetainyl-CoA:carnitine CoA-transferase CaiB-like acyl-CoA transferase
VSLFDATAEWMAVPLIHLDYAGRAPTRMGLAHPSVAPYGLFATADDKEILIAIQNEREWRRFCAEILGDAALAEDPRFSDNNKRVHHRAEVDALVGAIFARHSRSALAGKLKSAGIAFGNFNTVEDFSHHPHLRRIVVETPEGPVQLPAAPAIFDELRQPCRVPALGDHTAAVRAEFAR